MINLVMARESLPAAGPSVFLAGPTPDKSSPVPSWRPAAVEALAAQWAGEQPLTVLSPESRDGKRAARYEDQVDWESTARACASAILFWIPRDMRTLPGMTTNVEFGLDVASGRAVLGCPPDCPNPERNRYLIYVARRHGVPVLTTLGDTAAAALALLTAAGDAAAIEHRNVHRPLLPPSVHSRTRHDAPTRAAVTRALLADSLEIALLGGCGLCDTEADHMCAACGRCRCHTHDKCTREGALHV